MRESLEEKGVETPLSSPNIAGIAMVVNNHCLKIDCWLKGNLNNAIIFFAKNLHLDCNLIQNQLKIS